MYQEALSQNVNYFLTLTYILMKSSTNHIFDLNCTRQENNY
jgi:hypothetical protein